MVFKNLKIFVFIICTSLSVSLLTQLCSYAADPKDVEIIKAVQDLSTIWLKRPELQHSLVSIEIMHLPSGKIIFSYNGNKRMVPASTTKLVTTACAFDQFGADYKFKTQFVGRGEIKSGRVSGDLLVIPSQDPSLLSENIRQLIADLKKQGIKSIYGKLEIAKIPGGLDHFCSAWLTQDWGQDWMPVSSNLVIDRNIASSKDMGHGYPVSTFSFEEARAALLKSLLISEWAPAWVEFNPVSQSVYFYRPTKPVIGSFVVANPEQYNLAMIKLMLKNVGIKVLGHVADNNIHDHIVLAEHFSKPLSHIIHHTLKESDNLYAQQLLRLLGTLPVKEANLQNASLEEKGLSHISNWLNTIGVQPSDVVLYDGCGLSRKDCLTPHALNLVLKHMSAKPSFFDLLPIDGEEQSAVSNFHYKTGAMDSVRSITGIIKTAANETLALTIIINAHSPSVRELRASLKSLINRLQLLGKVPIDLLKSDADIVKKQTKQVHRTKRGKSNNIRSHRVTGGRKR